MPTTNLEKLIKQRRDTQGVLRPLLENFMLKPVNIESDRDVMFLTQLLKKMADREDRRRDPNVKVYSPSALASCLRHVYLKRNHTALGITPVYRPRVEPNFYFLNGNFLHIKWQFALWKMAQIYSDPSVFRLVGVEIPILSKRGDHGGTVDAIVSILGENYIVDFKGLNVRGFGEITRGFVPLDYQMQLRDYMMLWNAQPQHMADENFIKKSLLMVENKGGPDPKHPLALHEVLISYNAAEVKGRLKTLREHEAAEEIPKPECTSVNSFQFQDCPFAGYCREEVKVIERKRRKADSKNPTQYRIAIPEKRRNRRSRGDTK
jgi:hypothetical protein